MCPNLEPCKSPADSLLYMIQLGRVSLGGQQGGHHCHPDFFKWLAKSALLACLSDFADNSCGSWGCFAFSNASCLRRELLGGKDEGCCLIYWKQTTSGPNFSRKLQDELELLEARIVGCVKSSARLWVFNTRIWINYALMDWHYAVYFDMFFNVIDVTTCNVVFFGRCSRRQSRVIPTSC